MRYRIEVVIAKDTEVPEFFPQCSFGDYNKWQYLENERSSISQSTVRSRGCATEAKAMQVISDFKAQSKIKEVQYIEVQP